MKKIILVAALAAVAMAGCTKSETLDLNKSTKAIGFSNSIITRGTKAVTNSTWNVAAYNDNGVNGATSDYSNKLWSDVYTYVRGDRDACKFAKGGTPGYRYYDGQSTYNFLCWGNAVGEDASYVLLGDINTTTYPLVNDDDHPSITFAVPTGATLDLVKAMIESVDGTSQSDELDIVFYHTLSRVRFQFKTTSYDPQAQIVIKSVTLNVPKSSGSLDLTAAYNASGWNPWTPDASPVAGSYSLDNLKTTSLNQTSFDKWESTAGYQMFYIMPQGGFTTLTEAQIVVEYTVNGLPTDAPWQKKELTLKDKVTFETGKSYMFQITLDPNRIDFIPVVEEWVNANIVL